jgi:hypothetical protein
MKINRSDSIESRTDVSFLKETRTTTTTTTITTTTTTTITTTTTTVMVIVQGVFLVCA